MMIKNYTFLSDHSYSLRPEADDNDELPLNQREDKNRKRRRSSIRTTKATSTANRAVSMDRSSSDKENASLVSTKPARTSIPTTNSNKSSSDVRSNKKKSAPRSSTRTAMTNGKKHDDKSSVKTSIKLTNGSVTKKKKVIKRNVEKTLNISQNTFSDVPPSLSIEERVKLRRTKPLQPSVTSVESKPVKMNKIRPIKQEKTKSVSNKTTKSRKTSSPVKTTKLFLGSGLDLDNIVLGNRQRRCVQT
ncbi:unnamed protein product [Adineta ricciae]|uniref:Uncharacterized protein n=1 Tax=Adineta ricciae TaxID=249248 RepID=A0A816CM18_ADIRI|nr:unnamed protein product [Adineta ricciae]